MSVHARGHKWWARHEEQPQSTPDFSRVFLRKIRSLEALYYRVATEAIKSTLIDGDTVKSVKARHVESKIC
jgi:hypothetical protein